MADHPGSPLRSMRLKNLRRFEDTGDLDFAAVNFIFGKNSSGKTTLLRSPLLMKQLYNERSLVGGVPFSGPYVDFGSYAEAVYASEKSRNIGLSFEFPSRESIERLPRAVLRLVPEFDTMRIDAVLHWNATRGQAQFNSIEISATNDYKVAEFRRLGPGRIRVEFPSIGHLQTIHDASELGFSSITALQFEVNFPDASGGPGGQFLLYAINGILGSNLQRIHHVGPLRDSPERAYRIDQLSSSGGSTEHVVGMLVSQSSAIGPVSRALRQLGIARGVDLVQPAPGYAGIVLGDVQSARNDNLADVGFGASQVLPVLVRLALARSGSLLLVEQPELHLHPEVQGELAEVMVVQALDRGISILIESHSENMLLRLRRLIANGQVSANDVRIYVCDSGRVSRVDVDDRGRIDMGVFPRGFFEEEWEEAMGIIEGGATRR